MEEFGRPIPQGQCRWRPEGRRYPARASTSTRTPTSSTVRASSTQEASMAAAAANAGIMFTIFRISLICHELGYVKILDLCPSNVKFGKSNNLL